MNTKTPGYLTTLTPLRGIAALLIVLFHSNLMLMEYIPQGYSQFTSTGWLWVDFFFVLSGFIMSYVYKQMFAQNVTWVNYKRFMGARFSRIYPLHFITTIWAFIVVSIIVSKSSGFEPFFAAIFNPSSLPACLLLIQSLGLYITPPLNTPSWSLSTEWWVYVIFPFIVPIFAGLKQTGRIFMLVFIIAFFLFLRYVLGPLDAPFPDSPPSLNMIAKFAFFRCLAGFLAGMLVYEFYNIKAGYRFFKQSWCFILFFLAALAGIHFGVMDILVVALFPFIILTASYNDTAVKKFLDTRVLQRLGDWSFSIYMVHVPIIWTFTIASISKHPDKFKSFANMAAQPSDHRTGLLLCLLVVTCTILIASLSYRFIEVPARNYLNNAFQTNRKQVNPDAVQV